TGICVYQTMPAIIETKPIDITTLAPILVVSACATPAQSTAVPAVARNVRPVFSADQPSTCCTYRVRTKKFANVTPPRNRLETFAPATVLTRKMRNGISGSWTRDSITRNATINAAATASRPSVHAVPQPCDGAFETAYTSSASPAVTVTAPAQSGRTWRSERLSRTKRGARTNASAPTGTLTKKIHSQPRYFVSTPPASTPTAAPPPPIAPQIPSALLRSAPSSNVVVMIDSAAGEMIAAPSPCTARAATRTPPAHARPHSSEASVKTATPTRKTRRRPSRSAALPPRRRKPPNVIA